LFFSFETNPLRETTAVSLENKLKREKVIIFTGSDEKEAK
jgi:hypothetical protein